VIVLAHDVEIDDEARASVASRLTAVTQEFEDTIGHRGIPSKGAGSSHAFAIELRRMAMLGRSARWRREPTS
jgi:hypothetical protein